MLPLIVSLVVFLAGTGPDQVDRVWVFFTDKGIQGETEYEGFPGRLTDKAIERRVLNMGKVFDADDLPVSEQYVDRLVSLGAELRYKSNWLNAASFRIHPDLKKKIEMLNFVKMIKPVARYAETGVEKPRTQKLMDGLQNDTNQYKDTYGPSYIQAAMVNVPRAYFSGYTGSGVTVGMLDTGLKRKHTALNNVRIVNEHDFITGDDFFLDGDTIVKNVVLAQDPCLFVDGKNTLHLFYVADSLYFGQYSRFLFWASAPSWQPVAVSNVLADNAAINPTVTGNDTLFLAWQGFGLYWDSRINFGYYDGSWKDRHYITAGALPALTQYGDKLYLFYAAGDRSFALRTGSISVSGVAWSEERILFTGALPIGSTQAIADSVGNLSVLWTEFSSGKTFLSRSTDSGLNFSTPQVLDSLGGSAKALVANSAIHLVYKDYSLPPYTLLAYRNSLDWNKKFYLAGDTALYLGDFSIGSKGDSLTVIFESQGQIYTTVSTTNGQSWTKADVTPGSPDEFAYEPRVANNHVFWFYRGDNNTDADTTEDNPTQPSHGTRMLSVIGGYQYGQLVGIAPGADFIIAKTEKYKGLGSQELYEFLVEEDTWIEGLEWLEKAGADVVTSSLGYINWYQYQDMDGKTAPVSIAATLAAKRGLLLVNAIGNRSQTPGPYITAPGDAGGIITVGGTLTDSLYQVGRPLTDTLWWNEPTTRSGSGFGPTADGRMKPELLAPAAGIYAADPDSVNSYLGGTGTSFATALVAGCAALVKEAHPNWSLDSLRAVLFKTASNYWQPSDTLGYGLPNIDSAIHYTPPKPPPFYGNSLGDPFPNPFVPERQTLVSIPFLMLQPTWVELSIFTLSGELVKFIDLSEERNTTIFMPGRYDRRDPNDPFAAARWDGKNENGKPVAAGIYLVVLNTGYGRDIKKIALVR